MHNLKSPATPHQSGRIIELTSSALPMYYSEKIGRDYGSPTGGWTEHRDQATVMSQEKADGLLAGALLNSAAPNCRVVDAS